MKIIITENQFNKVLLNEYLDKNFGMPLYHYLNMNVKDERFLLFHWGLENELVQEYYKNDEGYDDLRTYFDDNYEVEVEDGEDYDEAYENEFYEFEEDFFGKMEYNQNEFIKFIWENYDLQNNLYNYLWDKCHNGEYLYEAPAFMFFSRPRLIKNKWLVHFSDNAYAIAKDGFKYGTQELDRLAYSGCGDIENKFGEGYDFAYDAISATDVFTIVDRNVKTPKYGNEFVLFQASGVEVFHDGDQENQVIFYGPSAKNIIYIKGNYPPSGVQGDVEWQVCDVTNNRIIYKTNNLEKVIEWAINNYSQYKNRIVSYNKNNNFEKNYNNG